MNSRSKHLNERENIHKLHFPHRMFLNGWVLVFFKFGMNWVRPLPTYRLTYYLIILTLNYLKLSFKEMRISLTTSYESWNTPSALNPATL